MQEILNNLVSNEGIFIPCLVAASILTGMLINAVTTVLTTSSRERTKREIAAYVAEGSMTPEHAERILRPGAGRNTRT